MYKASRPHSGNRRRWLPWFLALSTATILPEASFANPMNDVIEHIERSTGENPTATIIWLHGLGADGHDFEPIVPELDLPADTPVRFIFPHAPKQPVTINGGMVMRAWYDLTGTEFARREDAAGVMRSAQLIEKLIQREIERGIPSTRIFLAGFSQGGAIALQTGLRYPQPLAGILALSTYLPLADRLSSEAHASNRAVPIFMAHGLYDPVVPFALGDHSFQVLQENGYNIEWHSYPMPHSVHPDEIRDIGAWLRLRLAATNTNN